MLVVDDFGNEFFDQLASTLRRRGVRTVRIGGVGPGAHRLGLHRLTRWVRDRCLYDTNVGASEFGEDGSLPARLGVPSIVDVLCDENTLASAVCRHPAIVALAGRGLACARLAPERLLDKFEVNAVLGRAGVRVPPQLRASEISPREAVERFGLPLVVKADIGAAGAGVRIASSLDGVARAVETLSARRPGGVFYQRYVRGQTVMYGAVTGPDGPLLEHGFRVMATRWPLGPSAVVRLFDEPRLLAAGRRAARALGCLGLAEIGFIRDREGEVWHVDANLRPWGNMMSLLSAGIDYPTAYLAFLNGRPYDPQPPVRSAADVQDVPVIPAMLFKAASEGSRQELSETIAAFVAMCRRGPGLGYASIVLGKTAALLARRGFRGASRTLSVRRARPEDWSAGDRRASNAP